MYLQIGKITTNKILKNFFKPKINIINKIMFNKILSFNETRLEF